MEPMERLDTLDAALVARLEEYLLSHAILNEGVHFPQEKYSFTSPVPVPVVHREDTEALRCWFNVQAAVLNEEGEARFGWAFWEKTFEGGHRAYVAQPHAVLAEAVTGRLIDITPQIGCYENGCILFMADPRVGFDYEDPKQPPLLMLDLSETSEEGIEFLWVDREHKAVHVRNAWADFPDNFKPVV